MPSYRIWDWNPPFRAPKTIIIVYFLSNFFFGGCAILSTSYEDLQEPSVLGMLLFYFLFAFVVSRNDSSTFSQSHSIGSFIVVILGITYWYIWGTWLPKRKGYRLQREWVSDEDGISRYVFRQVLRSVLSHSTWAIGMGIRRTVCRSKLVAKTQSSQLFRTFVRQVDLSTTARSYYYITTNVWLVNYKFILSNTLAKK